MTFPLTDIIRDARIAMGLNPESEPMWHADAVCRQLTPDMAIRLRIEQEARAVCAEADDASLAECTLPMTAAPEFTSDHCGYIPLPPDFMRLCVIRMDDWERPVRKAIDTASQAYRMQHSRHAGLRGSPQRPGCAISCAEGRLTLEFYGCKSRMSKLKSALYHPYPAIIDEALAHMPKALYPQLIQRLAQPV